MKFFNDFSQTFQLLAEYVFREYMPTAGVIGGKLDHNWQNL